ncbi:beta-2 adrenergic receptor-like [Oculina patagonica]
MSGWYWKTGWLPSLLAVVGNSLVIYLILTVPKLRTTNNRFVLSLAIADFCVGICFYPGHAICHFLLTSCNKMIRDDIAVLMIYSSVSNLCVMALDRYIAIVKPLHYMSLMTARQATILTAFAWIIPLSTYFIPSVCVSLGLFSINFGVSVIVWTTIFEFVPCILLSLATAHAVIISRRHCRRDAQLDLQIRYNRPNQRRRRSSYSVTLIATVVAIFLACYAVEVYSSFCHFTELCVMNKNLYNLVRFLVIVNSAANPIAYALLKRDIKKELDKIFCYYSFKISKSKRSYADRTTSTV